VSELAARPISQKLLSEKSRAPKIEAQVVHPARSHAPEDFGRRHDPQPQAAGVFDVDLGASELVFWRSLTRRRLQYPKADSISRNAYRKTHPPTVNRLKVVSIGAPRGL
jgi:hypothetical protein